MLLKFNPIKVSSIETFVLILSVLLHIASSDVKITCQRTFEGCRSDRKPQEVDFDICHDKSESIVVDKAGMEVTGVVYENGSIAENLTHVGQLFIEKAVNMKFLPGGIKKIFPFLIKFGIISCGLTQIERKDMEQFGADLEIANFYDNPIESIPADLFAANPNLGIIEFSKCTLKTVDASFFTSLHSLKEIEYVGMKESGCIDQKYYKDDDGSIQKFEWKSADCNKKS